MAMQRRSTHAHLMVDAPELSAAVCVYLASAEADYLCGRFVSATWDLQQLLQRRDEILKRDLFKMQLAC